VWQAGQAGGGGAGGPLAAVASSFKCCSNYKPSDISVLTALTATAAFLADPGDA